MHNISCNTIVDILPLYVDEVVSDDTRKLVSEHLAHCDACQKKLERMRSAVTIPAESSVQPLKHFKAAWNKKKVLVAVFSVLITLILIVTGMIAYEELPFFQPTSIGIVRNIDTNGQWQMLPVEDSNYLIFDSIFYRKEVVLHADSSAQVALRFRDESGNIVLDNLILQPGTGVKLDKLERNTVYNVEIQTAGDFFLVRFV